MIERHKSVKDRRAIVSVPFRPDELAAVAQKARSEGKTTSRYIAESALRGVKIPTVHLLMDGETISCWQTS